jgi:endonuclease/exonuclease/phosphatase family metal-dependent hydrolase
VAHRVDPAGFVDELRAWGGRRPAGPAILVGDLNVAPLEHDVWSPASGPSTAEMWRASWRSQKLITSRVTSGRRERIELRAWGGRRPAGPAILVGDLNVAPLEHDVWSHKHVEIVDRDAGGRTRLGPEHRRDVAGVLALAEAHHPRRPGDPRRRPQRGAARARRLVPQAAPRRGEPHPDFTVSARSGVTQMWSRRRPLSAAAQSGER